MIQTKIEASDLAGYNWDWNTKYGPEVTAELLAAFLKVLQASGAEIPLDIMNQMAADYALHRSGEMIALVTDETRKRVAIVVDNAIREGKSLGQLQKALREDFAFSKLRAECIARTETATALGQGNKAVAISQGEDQKRWRTAGDNLVSQEICAPNEAAGWIGIADAFPSGHDSIPGHVNCRCNVIFRTKALHEEPITESVARKRCPECNAILVLNKDGPGLWCPRCKKARA